MIGQSDQPGGILKHMVPLGVILGLTPVSKVYAPDRVIAIADVHNKAIYLSQPLLEVVKDRLYIKESDDSSYVIERGKLVGTYRRDLITHLDLARTPLQAGNVYMIARAVCVPVAKGACHNIYDTKDGSFWKSWKATTDTEWCAPGNDYCKEIWQENVMSLYPEPNCRGTPEQIKDSLAFCVIE